MSEILTAFIWVSVPCGIALTGFLVWLNRMHPQHPPLPSAEDLRKELAEHKEEVKKQLDNIQGKLEIRAMRPGTRA